MGKKNVGTNIFSIGGKKWLVVIFLNQFQTKNSSVLFSLHVFPLKFTEKDPTVKTEHFLACHLFSMYFDVLISVFGAYLHTWAVLGELIIIKKWRKIDIFRHFAVSMVDKSAFRICMFYWTLCYKFAFGNKTYICTSERVISQKLALEKKLAPLGHSKNICILRHSKENRNDCDFLLHSSVENSETKKSKNNSYSAAFALH